MENYFSIWLSSANRKLVAKVATKNSQNSQLAELRQTSLPKLVGLQNLIGKMVSQAPFSSSSQNLGPLGRRVNLPPLTFWPPTWLLRNFFIFFLFTNP